MRWYKESRWFTLLAVLVLIGILSSGCAKRQLHLPKQEPVAGPTSEQPIVVTDCYDCLNHCSPEKTQIVIVIAEDPPSFNPIRGSNRI